MNNYRYTVELKSGAVEHVVSDSHAGAVKLAQTLYSNIAKRVDGEPKVDMDFRQWNESTQKKEIK